MAHILEITRIFANVPTLSDVCLCSSRLVNNFDQLINSSGPSSYLIFQGLNTSSNIFLKHLLNGFFQPRKAVSYRKMCVAGLYHTICFKYCTLLVLHWLVPKQQQEPPSVQQVEPHMQTFPLLLEKMRSNPFYKQVSQLG